MLAPWAGRASGNNYKIKCRREGVKCCDKFYCGLFAFCFIFTCMSFLVTVRMNRRNLTILHEAGCREVCVKISQNKSGSNKPLGYAANQKIHVNKYCTIALNDYDRRLVKCMERDVFLKFTIL